MTYRPPRYGTMWDHQKREFDEHKDDDARGLFWGMRTGKSRAMVDLACYRYDVRKDVDCVVVFAPNGVHEDWVNFHAPTHVWEHIGFNALAWSSQRARDRRFIAAAEAMLRDPALCFFAFNVESLTGSTLAKEWVAKFVRGRRVMAVFDESQDLGTPGSKRTKSARALTHKTVVRRILSGTPLEDSPLKAYSQFELLEQGALGFRSTGTQKTGDYVSGWQKFNEHYAEYVEAYASGRKYLKLDGYKNLDDLMERMSRWTSVVLREDCGDMPELVRSKRFYEPSPQQYALYRRIFDDEVMERANGTLDAFEGGVRELKLQQVLGGFFVDGDGELTRLPGQNPRVDATVDEVRRGLARGKVVVWAWFREEIRMIADRLRSEGLEFVEYHGGVKQADRMAIRKTFLEPGGPVVMLANPSAGGKGTNFSSAKTMVWHSYSRRAETRAQAEERCTLMGGEDVDVVYVAASPPADGWVNQMIDDYSLQDLDRKSSLADETSRAGLRDYVEAQTLAYRGMGLG